MNDMWSDRIGFLESAIASPSLRKRIAEDRERARDFCAEAVRPLADEIDRSVQGGYLELPRAAADVFARWNWLSWWLPRWWGGEGAHPLTMLVAMEEISRECLGFANILGAHYMGCSVLASTWNFPLLAKLTRDIAAGESEGRARLVTAAITEPSAGSDLEDLDLIPKAERSLWAEREAGGGYKVQGAKQFISNAVWASWHVVVAPVRSGDGSYSVIALLPADRPGIEAGRPERKLGQHACPASPFYFENVRIHADEVAIEPEQFGSYEDFVAFSRCAHHDILSMSRTGVAAMGAGAGERVFEETARALEALPELQGRQYAQATLAEMAVEILRARNAAFASHARVYENGPLRRLNDEVIERLARSLGESPLRWLGGMIATPMLTKKFRTRRMALESEAEAAIRSGWGSYAKVEGSAVPERLARRAIELLGPEAIRLAPGLFKVLRDAKLLSIYEGTDGLNRLNVHGAWLSDGRGSFEEAPWI